jgi:hypothetical protein
MKYEEGSNMLSPVVLSDTNSKFEAELKRVEVNLADMVYEKTSNLKGVCVSKGAAVACVALSVEIPQGQGPNMCLAPPLLEKMPLFPHVVVKKDYAYQWARASDPLQGCSCVVQPMHGYALILVVPVRFLVSSDVGLENLDATIIANDKLKKEKQSFQVAAFPMIGCSRGKSVYIPFGHVPLVVMTESPEEERSSRYVEGFGSYLLWYIGYKPPQGHDDMVLAECHSSMTKSVATLKFLKAKKHFGDEVHKYLASWDPAKAFPMTPASWDSKNLQQHD